MLYEVKNTYYSDTCFQIMKKLEVCHELLQQLPRSAARTQAYEHLEEAHSFISLLIPSE